ncbi:MAG: GrpB family protein [Candidatus Hodarchaeota archaeon]
MIGFKRGKIKLLPYQLEWKELFSKEKQHLEATIGNNILEIEHIGSTAIPGMTAKPIIDIAIAIHNFEEAKVCIDLLEKIGYEYKGEFGISRRHYFVKGTPRRYHLHMNEITSENWKNHISFRDYLIKHPDKAKQYADLKIKPAQQFKANREAYIEGKTSFIKKILQLSK